MIESELSSWSANERTHPCVRVAGILPASNAKKGAVMDDGEPPAGMPALLTAVEGLPGRRR
jgi:hypothetical protein